MKKNAFVFIINNIIVISVIIICCIVILNNVIKSLQGKEYVIVDEKNKKYIEKIISQYQEVKGNLVRIEYMQELGDWSLWLYYDNEKIYRTSFGDSQAYEIKQYIRDNGHNEGKESWNKIKIFTAIIIIMIIYELIYICIRCANKQKEDI